MRDRLMCSDNVSADEFAMRQLRDVMANTNPQVAFDCLHTLLSTDILQSQNIYPMLQSVFIYLLKKAETIEQLTEMDRCFTMFWTCSNRANYHDVVRSVTLLQTASLVVSRIDQTVEHFVKRSKMLELIQFLTEQKKIVVVTTDKIADFNVVAGINQVELLAAKVTLEKCLTEANSRCYKKLQTLKLSQLDAFTFNKEAYHWVGEQLKTIDRDQYASFSVWIKHYFYDKINKVKQNDLKNLYEIFLEIKHLPRSMYGLSPELYYSVFFPLKSLINCLRSSSIPAKKRKQFAERMIAVIESIFQEGSLLEDLRASLVTACQNRRAVKHLFVETRILESEVGSKQPMLLQSLRLLWLSELASQTLRLVLISPGVKETHKDSIDTLAAAINQRFYDMGYAMIDPKQVIYTGVQPGGSPTQKSAKLSSERGIDKYFYGKNITGYCHVAIVSGSPQDWDSYAPLIIHPNEFIDTYEEPRLWRDFVAQELPVETHVLPAKKPELGKPEDAKVASSQDAATTTAFDDDAELKLRLEKGYVLPTPKVTPAMGECRKRNRESESTQRFRFAKSVGYNDEGTVFNALV